MATEISARFWAKVDKRGPSDCWPWRACHSPRWRGGHGSFRANGKIYGAHVYSWILVNEKKPKLLILHKCGVAVCVNPQHLYEGTQKQNVLDSVAHGTHYEAEIDTDLLPAA